MASAVTRVRRRLRRDLGRGFGNLEASKMLRKKSKGSKKFRKEIARDLKLYRLAGGTFSSGGRRMNSLGALKP